jgi:hypothetical protein
MPSSAVPNTDLPDTDLSNSDLPDSDLPDSDLPDTGSGATPETGPGCGPETSPWAPTATLLRCGGCGASAVIDQGEQHYGGLVHSFLGDHSGCGNAVQITRSQPETA